MKTTIILILFMFSFNCLMAVPVQIKGKVQEKGTGNPIEFADVVLTKKGETDPASFTHTKENGDFHLSGIAKGEYSLMVRLIGYDIYTQGAISITSSESVTDLGVIELQPLEVGIAEVVVQAAKRQVIYKLDKKIIDASNNLMSSGGTAVDILENTPSVRVDVNGEVTFRGSSGFKVYIDGKPSFYSGSQALQQIPSTQIENIEIITTPSARYDTDGEVGMINIITKKNKQAGINGIVNAYGSTTLSNGLDFLLSQQHKKLQWHLAGHWNTPIRKSDFEQRKTTVVGTRPPLPCPTVRESERIITMGCGEALIMLLLPKRPSMQSCRWYMTSLPAKGTSIIQRHIPIPTQHPPHPTILAATNMTCTRRSILEKQDSPISLTTTGIP